MQWKEIFKSLIVKNLILNFLNGNNFIIFIEVLYLLDF